MNPEELKTFLDRPFTAIVATINSDGTPHTVPVWYCYDGSVFIIWTDDGRHWVKNVRRRRVVSLAIAEQGEPYSAALVRGTAVVETEGPGLAAEVRRISARYMPAEDVEAYAERWKALRTIVRITPERIQSWGRGY